MSVSLKSNITNPALETSVLSFLQQNKIEPVIQGVANAGLQF